MQPQISKCYYHPERNAVATCSKCGAGICRDCAVKDGQGRIICRQCANEELRQEQKDYRKRLKERGGRFRTGKDFIAPGIIGILIIIAAEIWLIYDGSFYQTSLSNGASSLASLILTNIMLAYWLFSMPFCYLVLRDLIPVYHSTTALGLVNAVKLVFKLFVIVFLGWLVFTILWLRLILQRIVSQKDKP